MGFNTPETYDAKCAEEHRLGIIATAALQKLIAGAKDVRPVTSGRLDRYGRTLGRLYVDNRDVGRLLTEKGLAEPYDGRGPRKDWCLD
jgi:micrococcal nuclease